jgi:bifunctional NMN adenylyltransferase/nudix hydrolase
MKKYQIAIYIGRFQPFHVAHQKIVEESLKIADKVIFVIGSDLSPRTIKNPFTADERIDLIKLNLKQYEDRLHFVKCRDYLYNNNIWFSHVENKVKEVISENETNICLVGSLKDDSSFYLKMFPKWKKEIFYYNKKNDIISATDIRDYLFTFENNFDNTDISDITKKWLLQFIDEKKSIFLNLKDEYNYIKKYKESWSKTPFPVIFQTVDAVVFKSAHVLVIKRGFNPGKGTFALPGGFIKENETLLNACVRELYEETSILYPKQDLIDAYANSKCFDAPSRSLRGRTVTQAFNFNLGTGDLPNVKGGDDAKEAFWMSFSEVSKNINNFFEDHAHIIEHFMYRENK